MHPSTQPCSLRQASPADHDAIAHIWHASASLPGVGPAVMPSEAEMRKRVDLEVAAGWSVTLAIRGDDILGFVAIRPREAVLAELFVRPGSIGGGIGRALLAHAMAAMPEGFTLYTRSANAKACRFYDRAGLVVLRLDTHPRTGDPVTHYRWSRV